MNTPCAAAPEAAFQRIQRGFVGAIRDPGEGARPEGVAPARMALYRELVLNNLSSLLASGFPVLHAIGGEGWWEGLVSDFLRDHRPRTPLFPRIGREFLGYLERCRGERPEDPPFLWELAHYEWLEVELGLSEEEPTADGVDRDGDLLDGTPLLSPLVRLHHYRYPVHRIGPTHQPVEAGGSPTHLVVYRDRRDRVGFLEANPVTARLIQRLWDHPQRCGRAHLTRIAEELNHPNPAVVIEGGAAILDELRRRDIIVGTPTQPSGEER